MALKVAHDCPQCGAPITFKESERIVSCQFCRVRSVLITDGPTRYFLPPRVKGDQGIYYAPYWRIKGDLYWKTGNTIASRFVDTTRSASKISSLPISMGLRPQSMLLRLFFPDGQNSLAADRPFKEAFEELSRSFYLSLDASFCFVSHSYSILPPGR
ncbi:MAG: hypothetical protein ACK4WB_01735 [Desulfatiglandales bacterium]